MAVQIDYVVSFTFNEDQLPALRVEAQQRFDSATGEERKLAGFGDVQFDPSDVHHCAQILLRDADDLIGGGKLEYQEASWGVAGVNEVAEF
ncbi:hypothetical protein [Stenotrophomonas sp. PD6]|uniref:hypothetical protein n=1 Tax=Stenotrophomonas sp. PD6 TaxID=3368612 RepID=UPI003B9EC2FF